jgi:hypothetical protein
MNALCNYIMSTDANKVQGIQQKSAALCFNHFFPHIHYNYSLALEHLKLYTLCTRKCHLKPLLLIQVYLSSKLCHFVLETVGLRVLSWYITDLSLFNVSSPSITCPSARCTSAGHVACRDIDVFETKTVFLHYIL